MFIFREYVSCVLGRGRPILSIVRHKPRLLSDNGPCYISSHLRQWLKAQAMNHTRGAPYHPQTQAKIERYHRSMKNVVKLENYYFPWEALNESQR